MCIRDSYCKHFKAYQPLNTWWAATSNCAFFDEAARLLPAGVTRLYLLLGHGRL